MNPGSKKADLELLKNLSVLHVEDDDNVRESLLRFLQRRFNTIYSAADGKKGLEYFEVHQPDLIVTDIQMPVMDGLEMSKRIKQMAPDKPIIITTAYNEKPFLTRAVEIGINRYIKKPIEKDDFLNSLYESAVVVLQSKEVENKEKTSRSLIDLIPCPSVLFDRDGRIILANLSMLNDLEYESMEEFVRLHEYIWNIIYTEEGYQVAHNGEELSLIYAMAKAGLHRTCARGQNGKSTPFGHMRMSTNDSAGMILIAFVEVDNDHQKNDSVPGIFSSSDIC